MHEYGIKSVCSNTKFVYVGSEDGILITLRKVRGGRLEAVNDGIRIGSKDAVVWANEDMVIAAQYNSEVLLASVNSCNNITSFDEKNPDYLY